MTLEADAGFLESVTIFIKGALAFTVSQAWNSAVQDFLERQSLFKGYSKFIYALFVTLIAVYFLKIIINIKKLLEKCQDGLNSQCFQWKQVFVGGARAATSD